MPDLPSALTTLPFEAVTFLFTDIEGSSAAVGARSRRACGWRSPRHDASCAPPSRAHRGTVVKMTGDGVHAVFRDPRLDAVARRARPAAGARGPGTTVDLYLPVRCGLHAGVEERRDNDYFGPSVNRAARIMSAAPTAGRC